MRRAACIEYDGGGYCGWQSQPHAPNVQDTLEAALSRLADTPIRTVCSGRTDSGVHAQGQVVHFDVAVERSERAWLLGSNRFLPGDIAVQWCVPVADDFHARFGALAREYRYWIVDRAAPTALWRGRVLHSHHRLDTHAMQQAARHLLGYQDFSAFRAAACQAKTPWRTVESVQLARRGDWIRVDIRANAFLHHMVRNIVGSLLPVGRGQRAPDWIAELLAAGVRCRAGMTAPAHGLSLRRVHYPDRFALPAPDDAGW